MSSKLCTKCGETKDVADFYEAAGKPTSACKACYRARANAYYRNNKDKVLAREADRRASVDWPAKCRSYHKQHWAKKLLHSAQARSKDRQHDPPTITEAWILAQPLRCPYLDVPLDVSGVGSKAPWSPSLDRIDNNKGYTPDNVRVTSWVWNLMRGPLSVEEALDVLTVIRSRQTRKVT